MRTLSVPVSAGSFQEYRSSVRMNESSANKRHGCGRPTIVSNGNAELPIWTCHDRKSCWTFFHNARAACLCVAVSPDPKVT